MTIAKIESSIGLDRLATRDEIRMAMSPSMRRVFEFVDDYDDLNDMESDFRGPTCNLREDAMWMAIIDEMPDSKSN